MRYLQRAALVACQTFFGLLAIETAAAQAAERSTRPTAPNERAPQAQAGQLAFRCEAPIQPPAPTSSTDESASVAKQPAHVSIHPPLPSTGYISLKWRRLTPPSSIGATQIHDLLITPTSVIGAGAGLWRSTDRGHTWQNVSAGVKMTRFGWYEDIVSLARIGTNLLAASDENLYRSVDDGVTWFVCGAPAFPPEREREGHSRQLAADEKVAHLSVGSSHFVSNDGGTTWTFAAGGFYTHPEALRMSTSGLWRFSGNTFYALARSLDDGQTWRPIDASIPINRDDHESILSSAEAGGTLFVASNHGAIYISRDKGEHFSSFRIGKGNGAWFPVGFRLWPVKDGVLAFTGYDLRRITKSGQTTLAYPREAFAVGTQGNDIVALSASYLARSTDGGKTWKEERLTGPLDDSVQQLSASGQNVAVVASGPTAFVSRDGGETWAPGPDLGKSAQVLATNKGFLVATDLDRVGQLLFAETPGVTWRQVTSQQAWGQYAPKLLAAEDRAFVVSSNGEYFASTDSGKTWQALPKPSQADGGTAGLLNGREFLLAPNVGLEHSVNGGAFESISASFPQDTNLIVRQLFRESSTYYAVASRLYAWRTGSKVEILSDKLALSREKRDYVQFAAAHDAQLLALVQNPHEQRLHFSRNRGKTWKEVMIGEPKDWITALAATDSGFLVGTGRQGLWLVTLP